MKILTDANYYGLLGLIDQAKEQAEALRATIRQMRDDHAREMEQLAVDFYKLKEQYENMKMAHYIETKGLNTALDISFPNTEERGFNDNTGDGLDFFDL